MATFFVENKELQRSKNISQLLFSGGGGLLLSRLIVEDSQDHLDETLNRQHNTTQQRSFTVSGWWHRVTRPICCTI
jgi:hypothetical protein